MGTSVKGIHGFNKSDGTSVVLAGYANDVVNVDTGLGYGLNIGGTRVDFETFLDMVFVQDGIITPRTFNGTTWGYNGVRKCPIFTGGIRQFKTRMYGLNATIPDINKPFTSRIFYTDLPTLDGSLDTVFWGLTWGTTGIAYNNTNRFRSENSTNPGINAGFKKYGIKIGDPLFIYDSRFALQKYTVASIIDDLEIRTVETFRLDAGTAIYTGINFWVGGNWQDVSTNNNDTGMWLIENNDKLMVFKKHSLHRWGGPGTPLQKVKGAPGTSSARSVVNVGKEYTMYFYGGNYQATGFYLYDGVSSTKISNAVQPFIDAIDPNFYGSVVGWKEGNVYRAYIDTLTGTNSSNKSFNISMSKAVFTYDSETGAQSVDPISDVIATTGYFLEGGKEKTLLGTDSGKILYTPSGNSFNVLPIPFKVATYPIYPRTTRFLNDFTRIQVLGRDLAGIRVYYKLWDNPLDVDQDWRPLGDLKWDRTELIVPKDHCYASGIQLMFEETSIRENSCVIEKITIFSVERTDIVNDRKK